MSVGAARGSLQNVISTLDLGLVNADVNLAESKDRVTKLREMMATTPKKIASPREGVERLSYEDSRTEMYKLKQERERLRQAYTEQEFAMVRRVESADRRLLRRELGGMNSDRTESVSEPNPVYQTLETSYLEARAKMAGDRARLAGLKTRKN